MAILRGATEQLINGSGGLIEVIGEPGIGKTRLVDEAVTQAGEVTTLRCDCERTGAGTPYTPVRRLLHQVLGTNSSMDPDTLANCLQDCVTTAAPELRPWVSLLGVVLDVTIPPVLKWPSWRSSTVRSGYLSSSQICLSGWCRVQ